MNKQVIKFDTFRGQPDLKNGNTYVRRSTFVMACQVVYQFHQLHSYRGNLSKHLENDVQENGFSKRQIFKYNPTSSIFSRFHQCRVGEVS